MIQETLLASSNISVTIESLTMVNQTANYPWFDFSNTVIQAKYLKKSKEQMTFLVVSCEYCIRFWRGFVKICQTCSMDVWCNNIWRDLSTSYNVNMGSLIKLRLPLCITFTGENGIDAGAFKVEFFSKVSGVGRKDLIESISHMRWNDMPKLSEGNHLLLQQGPYLIFWHHR